MKIEEALKIALEAHSGQVDKAGEPYILHPLYVANNLSVDDMDTYIVALLHDVFEDSNIKLASFRNKLTEEQHTALDLLTRKPGQTYGEYIAGISKSYMASVAKISDLCHNISYTRMEKAINNGYSREWMTYKSEIYHASFEILNNGIEDVVLSYEVIIKAIDSIKKPKRK